MDAAEVETASPKLHYWDAFWDHRPSECPCDEDFVAWLDEEGIREQAIFHFGTGGHHLVGIACAEAGRRNSVFGITAAPEEHARFVDLAIARPDVLRHYTCLFGDLYLLNPDLLPRFDVVTLFHLCEFRTEKNDAYGALTDRAVLDLLTEKLRPGGRILFFPRSFAWRRDATSAADIVADWAQDTPGIVEDESFRSLVVYRKGD